MKFSTVAATAAIAAGVDAQRFNFGQAPPTFSIPAAFGSNPFAFNPGSFSVPPQIASLIPSQYAAEFAGASQTGIPKLGNTAIPIGQSQTFTASSYGSMKTIVPNIPTATTSSALSTGTGLAGNSTAANATQSTSQDAKNNPNLPNGPLHRGNWAPGFDINTNTDQSWPNTGVTNKYTLTITNGTCAPQGDSKLCFLVNGQFPGPLIQGNWGDNFEITIINQLQNNGTSIHWHGFQQRNSNTQDGVNGVTECPLAPGDSKTYNFQATSYGTTWYHSHFSGQYAEGILGPVIINGPTSANYDIDLGTVMIQDYYPLTAFQEAYIAARFGPPTATNYLINGQNAKVDGSGGTRAKFTFTPGKKHKLRLINTSTDQHFKFQLDGHQLIVVQADYVPINPYVTNELSISIGQRYDVIVVANQPVSSYWMRGMLAADCSFGSNDGTGTANAIVQYAGASSALPTTKAYTHSDACVDEPLTALVPIVTQVVDASLFSSAEVSLAVGAGTVVTNNDTVFQWTLGGISQVIDWSNPTLSQAVIPNNTYGVAKHVITLNSANTWTFWVLQNSFFVPHPMHLHGHDFAILGQGDGVFSASSDLASLNFNSPMRRDVAMLTARGWTVIAFNTNNPGAWLMHCHIAWHVGGGLSLQFLERPNDIPGLFKTQVSNSAYSNTCSNWKNYYAKTIYKQSDSGLRKRELIADKDIEFEVLDVLPERRAADVKLAKRHENRYVRRSVKHWV